MSTFSYTLMLSGFFCGSTGDHHCAGQQAGQAGRAESRLQHGSELGQEREGATVGGVGGGAAHSYRTFCLPGEQDDAATEQVHFPPQPQQE